MNRIVILLFSLAIASPVFAQNIGYSVNASVRKTFNFKKKSSLDLRQQIQLTPEIERYDNKYGDFFNEEGFWSIPDRYRNDNDLDDDDDDDLPPGAGTGIPLNGRELNDSPTEINWDLRSNTSFQFNYRARPWLRANTGYSLFYNGEELRHTMRAELDYRPLRHTKSKKTLDLAARVLYQRVGQPDDDKFEWNSFLIPRFDTEWTFKKNHILLISPALNGVWDDGKLEWDRWRVNTSMAFIYQKIHRFTFSYQFQQRLDKPRKSHGVSIGYEVRL